MSGELGGGGARSQVGEGRLAAVPDRLAAWPHAREALPAAPARGRTP